MLPSRLKLNNFISWLVSIGLVGLCLFFLWLSDRIKIIDNPPLVLREISIVELPPPPPPTNLMNPTDAPPLSFSVNGQGASVIAIEVDPIEVSSIQPQLTLTAIQAPQWSAQSLNLNAFDLEQLDELPKLLTPVKIEFPTSLKRRGINQALVKLEVLIDEQGQVNLIDIRYNQYPELNEAIRKMSNVSRFTSPKKNGSSVRARFVWPVEINH